MKATFDQQMDPRIQVGDVIYFLSADGSKILCLDDPTQFQMIPETNFINMKFKAQLLDQSNIQNLPNRCFFKICTSKAKEGTQVRYGDTVCFKLDSSSCYIVQLTESEDDMAFNKIAFQPYDNDPNIAPYPKKYCWRFKPKYKHRKEGGYVFENDKVSIETLRDMEGYLTPMFNGQLASGLNEYEWKIKSFSDVGDISLLQIGETMEVPIRAQEPVTLFSVDSQKYMGIEAGAGESTLKDYIEKYLKDSSHTLSLLENEEKESKNFYFQTNGQYRQKIFAEQQLETEQQPFNGLYRIELEDPLSNDTLKTGQKVRIRHVQYGCYLTLISKEKFELIKKNEMQDTTNLSLITEEDELPQDAEEEEEELEEQEPISEILKKQPEQSLSRFDIMAKAEQLKKSATQKLESVGSKFQQIKEKVDQKRATEKGQDIKDSIIEEKQQLQFEKKKPTQ